MISPPAGSASGPTSRCASRSPTLRALSDWPRIALLTPRTARMGAVTLTAVYSVFTLLWAPNALVDVFRQDYGFRLDTMPRAMCLRSFPWSLPGLCCAQSCSGRLVGFAA